MNNVKSPCIFVCKYNSDKLCEGCFRTSDEITNWSKFSNKKKLEIIKNSNKRKADYKNEDYWGMLG